jgi:hypothetical protein
LVSRNHDTNVFLVVGELRHVFEIVLSCRWAAARWDIHAWPDVGDDAENVVNREIGAWDIVVGIMWKRFGTPIKQPRSKADEESQKRA